MHTPQLLALALLAVVGASAATTVTDWGTLGPAETDVHASTYIAGAVDDIDTFNLGDYSDVPSTANDYQATSMSGMKTIDFTDAQIALFSGTYGDGVTDTQVASCTFGTAMTPYTFAGLPAGAYYFEVTGNAGTKGSDDDFDVEANSATPPLSAVPEPENLALMSAGVGLFGFMAARRRARRSRVPGRVDDPAWRGFMDVQPWIGAASPAAVGADSPGGPGFHRGWIDRPRSALAPRILADDVDSRCRQSSLR